MEQTASIWKTKERKQSIVFASSSIGFSIRIDRWHPRRSDWHQPGSAGIVGCTDKVLEMIVEPFEETSFLDGQRTVNPRQSLAGPTALHQRATLQYCR